MIDAAEVHPSPASMPPRVMAAKGEERRLPASNQDHDPDRFIKIARQVVIDQIRSSSVANRRNIDDNGAYVVWFAKVLGNWKAIVASPIIRTQMWEVTYNGNKNEIYIDVYRRQENVKIIQGGTKT